MTPDVKWILDLSTLITAGVAVFILSSHVGHSAEMASSQGVIPHHEPKQSSEEGLWLLRTTRMNGVGADKSGGTIGVIKCELPPGHAHGGAVLAA